jgi:energy-coupling factor transport system ATP-binding protein
MIQAIPINKKDQIALMKIILTTKREILKSILQSISISNEKSVHDKTLPSSAPLIIFEDISFQYKTSSSCKIALDHINTTIFPQDIIGLMGPNGAGKSTFVKMLNGLRKPESGKIWIKNLEISHTPVYELAKDVGIMFQNPDHQLFSNNIEEELHFSLKNLHLSAQDVDQRIIKTLTTLNISEIKSKSPFFVSGGQKKLVSIASILCRKTQIIVFDEPTIGQDANQKRLIKQLIRKLHQNGHTIIIITHDQEFILDLATRLLILIEGKIYTDGACNDIFANLHLLKNAHLQIPDIFDIFNELKKDFPELDNSNLTIQNIQEILQCL